MDTTPATSALLPPTLRVACAQSQPHWTSAWGPGVACVWDTANTLFGNVGTYQRLVPAAAVPPLTDHLDCTIVAKHLFEYNVQFACRPSETTGSMTSSMASRCVQNTTVWLSSVLSPVAEFDLWLPNVRSFVDLQHLPCDAVSQVLNCPGLPLNGSFYETTADVAFSAITEPIRCFLSYAMADGGQKQSTTTTIPSMINDAASMLMTTTTASACPDGVRSVAGVAHRPTDVEDVMRLMGGSYDWWFLCVLLFVVAGAVGNVLVCLAVVLDRRLQNVTNYFLFSLAIADLLVSLVVMPLGAIPSFIGYWPLSLTWCNIYVTCDVLACSASILHMCFISVGRYTGIRNPLGARHSSTKRRTFVKITIVWLMAMVVCSSITGLALLDEQNIMPNAHTCTINNRAFFVFGSLVTFYIPMVLMVSTYAATIRLLSKKAKFAQMHPDSEKWRRPPTIKTVAMPLNSASLSTAAPAAAHRCTAALISDAGSRSSCGGAPLDETTHKSNARIVDNAHKAAVTPSHSIRHTTANQSTQTPRHISTNRSPPGRNHPNHPSHEQHQLNGGSNGTSDPSHLHHRYKLKSFNFQFCNVTRPSINLNIRFLNRNTKRSNLSANAVATEQKATKVLGLVFFTFVLCWSPFFVLNIVFAACHNCLIPDHVVSVCLWLGYVSSTINPIIYTIFNRTFRAAFIRLLRCDCKTYSSAPRYRSVTDSRLSGGAVAAAGAGAPASSTRTTGTGCDDLQQQQHHQQQQQPQQQHHHHQQQYTMMTPGAAAARTTHRTAGAASGDLNVRDEGGGGASLLEACILHTTQTHRLAEFGASYAITDDEC